MATVRILTNVFDRGAIRWPAGTVVEVDQQDVDRVVRRGWGVVIERPPQPAPVESATKRKGK